MPAAVGIQVPSSFLAGSLVLPPCTLMAGTQALPPLAVVTVAANITVPHHRVGTNMPSSPSGAVTITSTGVTALRTSLDCFTTRTTATLAPPSSSSVRKGMMINLP
ncbi:hypothetical protein PF005_g9682 [Phytophthora fragariae]|uniref:Uncharacterized protein n=1 Tax=Phytophthora fragariae TaxID=53985 RepID=A0A6A3SIE8_9STRA|nr:hypothetical protein PF003_g14149 [Phytophthora fragariae]KAE8936092.1 hypothetical protein PF009_g13977 [Phytophthora fragariae]KAE9117507.1 hypothetical protein PF007_g9261 [Phytophthora fragariae]KAE9138313.1 hypothetical protein PF006_g13974 [Phytophthora fragariae]KAE9214807.1 hypothetical protein PF005_g9682 [Phytophthora fragariae]